MDAKLQRFLDKIRGKTSAHSQLLSWWEFEVRDKDGKVIQRVRQPAQSLVMNAVDILRVQWFQTTGYTMRNTGGTYGSESYLNGNMIYGSAGDLGVVVGLDSVTPAIADYKLSTKILHGSGVNQLLYATNVFVPTVVDGSTAYFSIAMPLTNNSAAPVTFNEAGVYVRMSSYYYCIEHASVSPGITIPTGGSATVNYHLGVSCSGI